MKIDSSPPSSVTASRARPQNATNKAAPATAASETPVAAHLQQAGSLGSAEAPFDSQRVADIRQAIAEGHFQIDTDKIATRLIDGVREMLAKDRPTA